MDEEQEHLQVMVASIVTTPYAPFWFSLEITEIFRECEEFKVRSVQITHQFLQCLTLLYTLPLAIEEEL